MDDEVWLARAVELATDAARTDGGPFGSVVVLDGAVVGEGVNEVTGTNDPTAHAEVVAIRRAGTALGTHELRGAVVYASCEPCPMCLTASMWARVDRIVYAADRHDAAAAGFSDQEFYDLFTTPREQWRDLRCDQLRLDVAGRPFEAWQANPDKVVY